MVQDNIDKNNPMATHPAPAPVARPINRSAVAETILLGGTATILVIKWLRGQLDFYIHPRYTLIVLLSALLLLLMAGVRARSIFGGRGGGFGGGLYLLLALPLLLGTLVPAQPLGADTLSSRGIDLASAAPAANWKPVVETDSSRWNLLEWATSLSMQGDTLTGKPIDVIGFVYQDATTGADRFYVTRYVITCCAADGAGVGLPVEWSHGGSLPADSWVRVRGTIGTTMLKGSQQPAILATTVEPVAEPENPYLYP